MKSSLRVGRACGKAILVTLALLLVLFPLAAAQPLSQDDITLLLIGGASPQKMVTMVAERGVDFRMNPDLAKKFRRQGATDELIQALENASKKLFPTPQPAPPRASGRPQQKLPAEAQPPPAKPGAGESVGNETQSGPVLVEHPAGSVEGARLSPDAPPVAGTPGKAAAAASDLSDPSPDQIHNIIRAFSTKEKLFKEARDNYTYHQINKVETLDADNNADGYWEQDWDILYDNQGNRIEKVTYAPPDSLKRVLITEQDLDAMRNIQPFVLTVDELPDYEIKYLGHVKVDYITAYVFSIRPVEIKKGRQYFQGVIWVDDRDLQIVKTEGRQVPELRTKQGENLFPRFTTWRQQIDGKFWFPTFTMADDTLYFPGGPVHIKEIIRYTNYKQFKATSTIKMIGLEGPGKPQQPATKNPPPH